MTTHKHQSQTVVANLVFRENRFVGRGAVAIHQTSDFRLFVLKYLSSANHVQREIARRAHDPGRGIFRDSVERPGLQRPHKRFLNDVFREIEMFDAKDSGENGNHLRPLVTKKMFHYAGYFRLCLNSVFKDKVLGAGNLDCGACPRINIIADKIVRGTRSDPLFFQVVHVEPVMHHSVTRNELLNMILHILLELQRKIAQMESRFLSIWFSFFAVRRFTCLLSPGRT